MARPRGFKASSELLTLDDQQLEELVLSNWLKLNQVLMHKPSLDDLQRLMVLELSKGPGLRDNVVMRLRSALSSAIARDAREATTMASKILVDTWTEENEMFLEAALQIVGLTKFQTQQVIDNLRLK